MSPTLIARWILVAALVMGAAPPVISATTIAPVPTPQFRSFGLHEGLPSSKVQAVVQDSRGFIWVATAAGLSRFDGVEFTAPSMGTGRDQPLPIGSLSTLFIDRDDRLWMGGGDAGLAVYNPANGDFIQWHNRLDGGLVRAIAQTADRSLWVGTSKGLARMRPDGTDFTWLALAADDLGGSSVRALHATPDGRLWVGGDGGLQVIEPDGQARSVPFDDGLPARVLGLNGMNTELRVATTRGLFRMTYDGHLRLDRRLRPTATLASLADSHGVLWLSTPAGLSMLDRFGRQHDIAGAWTALGGLPGRTVRGMLEDREHGLWFALSDGGLAYLGPSWDDFTRFAHVATDRHSFPGRTVTAVAAREDGGLWVGGLRGWIRGFDPATGHTLSGYDVGNARIQSMLALPGHRLLVGTVDGLSIGEGGKTRPLLRHAVSEPVTAMVAGDDGRIFIAVATVGVFVIDAGLRQATAMPYAGASRGVADTQQLDIVDGQLWQASLAGLARQDPETAEMRLIEGVPPGRVSAFERDASGFWIVRPDALEHFRLEGNRAVRDRHVSGAEGFPSVDILNLRRDVHGRLWLYGQTGVWRFDPLRGRFRVFGLADGLASGEFTNATTVLLADGSMYGATLGGLVGFRPDAQRDHARRPSVSLLGASAVRDGQRQPLPMDEGGLHLAWGDRDVRLRARLLSFIQPDRNRLTFRLTRGDHAVVRHVDGRGECVFDALSPGNYVLSVSGTGRDDSHAAWPVSVDVSVDAPPWRRWWAWTGYTLAMLLIAVVVVRGTRRRVRQALRLRLAEHQKRMAEEASAAKTEFMATLGHEIRTPMTGVLGMAELLADTSLDTVQRSYVDVVRHSGGTLLRLLNDALDITRIEARRLVLESECVCVRTLASEVIALAAGNAREKGIALSVVIDADVPAGVRSDGVRLRQILQNLVNNAVKFTPEGGVALRVSRQGHTLLLCVADTGPGMSAELQGRLFCRFEQGGSPQRAQGSGLGLAICHELCVLMGGAITVESEPGRGCRMTVRLPLAPCAREGRPCAGSVPRHLGRPAYRLLLVEDDAVVSEVITRLLTSRGHVVVAVADGLAAMSELSVRSFDAVLLDLDLPMVDGFQVARMIRRNAALATLPLLAVTARSNGDELNAVQAAGMNGLLRKPMTGDDLDAQLDSLCGEPMASQSA